MNLNQIKQLNRLIVYLFPNNKMTLPKRLTTNEFISLGKHHGKETNGIVQASLFPKLVLPLIDNEIATLRKIAIYLNVEIIKQEHSSKTHLLLDFSKCKDTF